MQFAVAAHKLQLGEVEYYARKLQFGKLAAKKLLLWKTVNSSGSDCMQVRSQCKIEKGFMLL